MKRYFIITAIFILSVFIGCGGESGDTSLSTKIKIDTKQAILDPSEKRFFLDLFVTSKYPNDVSFELSNISLDINGCIISSSTLSQDSLKFIEKNEKHRIAITANFLKPCTPSGYIFKAKNSLTFKNKTNSTEYLSSYIPIKIDAKLPIDRDTAFNYDIELKAVNGSSKISLNETKRYKLYLKDGNGSSFNSNSNLVNKSVQSITIKSSDISKIALIDIASHATADEHRVDELKFKSIDDVDFYMSSGKISGIANIIVSIEYIDSSSIVHKVDKTLYLAILSGEPTAFSINSAGVKYDPVTKWFEEKFLISASDKYSNVVNSSPQINISAMADFRDKNGEGNRIVYGKSSSLKGSLVAEDGHKATFQVGSDIFANINPDRDFLLLFGDVISTEALGKWDINLYNNSSKTLSLVDSYYGSTHKNLGFAVGHNYIKDICSEESKEWEIKIDSTDGNYKLNDKGEAYITLRFPPYLVGKKVAISVNFSGKKRAGEVHFATLSSFEGVKVPKSINIAAEVKENNETNKTKIKVTPHTYHIFHSFSIDTGTKDEWDVYNAKVVCNINATNIKGLYSNILTSNNSEVTKFSDCKNNSVAYINIYFQLDDLTKAGSIKFQKCWVSSFF
jgi:hypothetical protein